MDRQVSLKKVLAVIGTLVVLGGTFYAGMAYQSHRIASSFEEAFSDFGDETDSATDADEADVEEPDVEPVEVAQGDTVTSVLADDSGATMEITFEKIRVTDGANASEEEDLVRNLEWTVKVKNIGDVDFDADLSGHFESAAGQVYDFAGVMCETDDLGYETLETGKFIQGCSSSDIPATAGQFIFDAFEEPLFIKVDAA
ncbi:MULTISPECIES: hypothetical protein [unclassified Aeromicrobium]|uniref:hypothetical protein n=1 Tax=unclassified Aeromicrobium TaxID=2633570 RepID=UPI00288A2540|nr:MULTISPECIES: hypothetical protein [unclassified Aeromicrobium]